MNKPEFIKVMQSHTGDEGNEWSKKDCETALDAFIESVIEVVSSGDNVSLVGFGKFASTIVKEKGGINPQTKERIIIPSRKRAKFSVGKAFKSAVEGNNG